MTLIRSWFCIQKKKLCLWLAVILALAVCYGVFGISGKAVLALSLAALIPAVVRIPVKRRSLCGLLPVLFAAAGCLLTVVLTQFILYKFPVLFQLDKLLLGMLCAAILTGLFAVFTGGLRSAVILSMFAWMVLATINLFVIAFRGTEIFVADIFAAYTAMKVAGQYSMTLPVDVVYAWAAWAVFSMALYCFDLQEKPVRSPILRRVLGAALCGGAVILFVLTSSGETVCRWQTEGSENNGFLLNFCLDAKESFVKRPDGYSDEAVETLAEAYETEPSALDRPNVLVIMNEAFSDLTVYGDTFRPTEDVLAYYHSLSDNAVKGYALSSIFGGRTANSEYEFLTGNSMAFLPASTVPYQQYVGEDCWSLVAYFEDLGYTTKALHPYFEKGWDRNKVYPAMGFDEMTFLDGFAQEDIIRYYVSDREVYDRVLEELEDDGPQFVFTVTMQNHGGFDDETYESTVFPEDAAGTYPDVEQYLTLMKESDAALEYLLTQLEQSERDTVVLLFGDHQPNLDSRFYDELLAGRTDLDGEQLQYLVPFLVWANYDIPEEEVPLTSLSFLSSYLLDAAALEAPAYMQFLADVQAVIPAMNSTAYYSAAQGTYVEYDAAQGQEAEWINKYHILEYHAIFEDDRNQTLFPAVG